jgi:hypothetical protein
VFIDLHKALERVEENLPKDRRITFEMLEKAYDQTLRLRSQILGVMYDLIDFGSATKRIIGEVSVSQTDSNQMVCLVIPEPLPGRKELTGTVEEHWVRMIHDAIAKQAKIGIPRFEKAHVHIRITAPRGTNNSKVWDTSNRAINVIINNLKGIFFDDDDFEHMSCSIEASWGKIGMTEVRICDHEDLKKCEIFR